MMKAIIILTCFLLPILNIKSLILIAQDVSFEVQGSSDKVKMQLTPNSPESGRSDIVFRGGHSTENQVTLSYESEDGQLSVRDKYGIKQLRLYTDGIKRFQLSNDLVLFKPRSNYGLQPLYIDNLGFVRNSESFDKYWSVSGSAFHSNEDIFQEHYEGTVRGRELSFDYLYASVHLPDRARPQELCAVVRNNSDRSEMIIQFRSHNLLSQVKTDYIDERTPPAAGGEYIEYCKLIENVQIDNSTEAYSIMVTATQSTWDATMSLASVKIRYR